MTIMTVSRRTKGLLASSYSTHLCNLELCLRPMKSQQSQWSKKSYIFGWRRDGSVQDEPKPCLEAMFLERAAGLLHWDELSYAFSVQSCCCSITFTLQYEGGSIEKFPRALALLSHQMYSSHWGQLKAISIPFGWGFDTLISNKRWLSDKPKCWRRHVHASTTQKAKKILEV